MVTLFYQKKMAVIRQLIMSLSKENQDDLEKTMNASMILQDFVENRTTFKLLVADGNLDLIIRICCEGPANKQNAPYAKHLLSNILH